MGPIEGFIRLASTALPFSLVKQPNSFPRRVCVRVMIFASTPDARGERSADRRILYLPRLRGATRPMTRDARLSALHRGGFWAPGPRFRLRHCLRSACSELLAARVVVPGGRIPVPP